MFFLGPVASHGVLWYYGVWKNDFLIFFDHFQIFFTFLRAIDVRYCCYFSLFSQFFAFFFYFVIFFPNSRCNGQDDTYYTFFCLPHVYWKSLEFGGDWPMHWRVRAAKIVILVIFQWFLVNNWSVSGVFCVLMGPGKKQKSGAIITKLQLFVVPMGTTNDWSTVAEGHFLPELESKNDWFFTFSF